jgi:hypothetical protein
MPDNTKTEESALKIVRKYNIEKIGFEVSWPTLSVMLVIGFMIIGILFALADVVNYSQLGKRFTPFSVAYPVSALTYDETQLYVPGARHFFENNSLNTEVDIFELRDVVGLYPIAHSIIIGSIAKVFGSLEASWVISHALFPASVWLLLFFCARMLQFSIMSAFFLATATCLIPFGPRDFFLLGRDAFIQPLELSRIPDPGLSFAVLLMAIIGLSQAVASSAIAIEVGAGILVGLNFYTYYFYWIAIGLGLSTWLLTAVILRRWAEVKTLCVVGLIATVTGLFYLRMIPIALQSQTQKNLMERVGWFGRDVSPTDLWTAIILTGSVLLFYVRGWMQRPLTVTLAFILAGGALGLNTHLLTGYNAQHGHFWNRCIQPLAFLLCGMVILQWLLRKPSQWLPRKQSHWTGVFGLVTLILLSLGAYRQVHVASAMAESHDRMQNSVQVIDTLRGRIAAGSVVGSTDPQVLTLLPAVSTLWTFVPLGDRSQASNDEILRRFLLLRKLQGATISDVHADFELTYPSKKEDRGLSYVLFLNTLVGTQLHANIDQIWPELDLKEDLSVRRLNVIMTSGTPQTLPKSSGWQLVKTERIGKWSIFNLQPLNP